MNPRARRRFDQLLEQVLEDLPPLVHELIEKVPLHVEDYPSADVLERTGARYRDEICGLFTGIPISDRSIQHSGNLPDVVTIYREGILAMAEDSKGRVRADRLKREIRVTILHELGHYHGLDEDDLRGLGYE
ncbi:MAG: metallopeptidase family protein [Planctomycetota bacterium]